MTMPQKLFDSRLEDLVTTINHKEPKRVPICMDAISWPTAYSGGKTDELVDEPERMASEYVRVFKDIYVDCILDPGVTYPIRSFQALEGKSFLISSDGVTIQHMMQDSIMKENEYDQLISDPDGFALNVLAKRKYDKLYASKEEAYTALKKAAVAFKKHIRLNQLIVDILREDFGIIRLWGDYFVPHPFDFIFDSLRGMKGALIDVRRQPEKLMEAIEVLCEKSMAEDKTNFDAIKGENWPFVRSGFHVVPYIGLKDFKKFWWPFFVKMYQPYIDAGVKIFLKSEGKSGYCFDMYRDLPKSSMIIQLEEDDPFDIHRRLGDVATIAAGITTNLLKYGTKQECIDYVKRCFDTFAPGGGFIFLQDRPLLCANDVKVDNLFAVYAFAKEYAKY
ncbi:MAG: hypothetical protein ACOWWR_18300 [Eubacteriales bacterium]